MSDSTATDNAALVVGLPPPPPADLDDVLDAAARCFERYGVSRTTVPDIAAELGVSRSTVYRRVGSTEACARLLFARELHGLLRRVSAALEEMRGPESVVGLLAMIARFCREHPVMQKVLRDELSIVGPFFVQEFGEVLRRVADIIAPVLTTASRRGVIARRDPRLLAEWLVRTTASVVLAPPPGDLDRYLAVILEPLLTPRTN